MPGVPLPSFLSAPTRSVRFDWTRVRWPEWVVGVSGLILLLAMVGVSWFTFDLPSGGTRATTPAAAGGGAPIHPLQTPVQVSKDGWNGAAHLHWLLLVTILVAFGLVVVQAGRRAPAVPATFSFLVILLGGLSVIWLIVRVVIDPAGGRELGGWLALISALVLTWGGYRSLRMEGIAPQDAPGDIPTVALADLPPSAEPQS
jgi:hypothetical protein